MDDERKGPLRWLEEFETRVAEKQNGRPGCIGAALQGILGLDVRGLVFRRLPPDRAPATIVFPLSNQVDKPNRHQRSDDYAHFQPVYSGPIGGNYRQGTGDRHVEVRTIGGVAVKPLE